MRILDAHAADLPAATQQSRSIRGAWALALLFLCFSLLISAYGRNERSGWLLLTTPGDPTSDELTILGSAVLHHGEPVMAENWSSVKHVSFFSGLRSAAGDQDYFLLRPVYSLLVTLLAPAAGVLTAMFLVNWVAWACSVWIVWRLTDRLFGDPIAAFLAATLAIGGIGMIVHIGDDSAHLLAYATYYAGVYALWESKVLIEPRPWSTHLRLAAFFALTVLVYSTGIMLVAVYMLSSIRRNRVMHVVTASAIALSARPGWQMWLRLTGTPVADVDRFALNDSLAWWRDHLAEGLLTTIVQASRVLTEFALFDSPLVILGGVLAFVWLSRDWPMRWFGGLVLAIPILSSFVFAFAPRATARGYLVYGASIWLYCWLGRLMSEGLRARGSGRSLSFVALAVVLVTHVGWATAHLWGWLGPVKTYFLGWDDGWTYLVHPRAAIASLTAQEPAAILFGGHAPLAAAGALVTDAFAPVAADAVSFMRALVARGPLFGSAGLLVATLMSTTRARQWGVGAVITAAVASAALSAMTFRTIPHAFDVASAIELAPGAHLTYRAALATEFLDLLTTHAGDADDVVVKLLPNDWNMARAIGHPWNDVAVTVTAGETTIPFDRTRIFWRLIGGREMLATLRQAGRIQIDVTNVSQRTLYVQGWQRYGLADRDAALRLAAAAAPTRPAVLPAFEIRVLRPDGSVKAVGF